MLCNAIDPTLFDPRAIFALSYVFENANLIFSVLELNLS